MGIVDSIITDKWLNFGEEHAADLLTCGVLFSTVNQNPRTIMDVVHNFTQDTHGGRKSIE